MSYCRTVICLALASTGCSTQELYETGQSWQQQECELIADQETSRHCMQNNKRSFDDYQYDLKTIK